MFADPPQKVTGLGLQSLVEVSLHQPTDRGLVMFVLFFQVSVACDGATACTYSMYLNLKPLI